MDKESIIKASYNLVIKSDIFDKTFRLRDIFVEKTSGGVILYEEKAGSHKCFSFGMAFKSKVGEKNIGLLFEVKDQKIISKARVIVGSLQVVCESEEGFQTGGSKSDVAELQAALGVLQATIKTFGVTDKTWVVR